MRITNHYVLRKILDESILVPISPSLKNRDCLFVLNPTARAMYEGFKGGLSREEVAKRVLDEFAEVTPTALESDLNQFVAQMIDIEAMHDSTQG